MVPLILGPDAPQNIRQIVARIIYDRIEVAFPAAYTVMEAHMDIEKTLAEKIKRMTSTDFIGLLRPAFEEEELKLIVVGGVLGLLVGLVQQYTLIPYLS